LAAVASKFTPPVVLRRYASNGTYSGITSRLRFKHFSSDAKRKSAAYDRVGFMLPVEYMRTGETELAGGDVVVFRDGTAHESLYLVGKVSFNHSSVPIHTGFFFGAFEALYMNARVNILEQGTTTHPLTGQVTPGNTMKLSSIPAVISSAELFVEQPYSEMKDQFFFSTPAVFNLAQGDVAQILSFSDTDNALEHEFYRIEYPYVDSIGIRRYRLTRDQSVE
jgi:hypothetical protein